MRKIITLGIMLLFLGMTISSSTGLYLEKQSIKPFSSGNILYVGGNGTGNYSKIQDAINAAWYGDTVFVYDDSSPYYENVVVNKTINLIGEDRDTTVIDGNDSKSDKVVFVDASDVAISNFTIQNSDGGGVLISTWDTGKIINNIIRYCHYGISVYGNYNISGNKIYSCERNGIVGYGSFNKIMDNTIQNNGWEGILLYGGSNNTIAFNTLSNNGCGIGFLYADNNTISENIITSNEYAGIVDSIYYSGNVYLNNTILMNGQYGIVTRGRNATIIGNSICFNEDTGIRLSTWLEYSNNTIITENIIAENGIGIENWYSNNSIIYHNDFINNTVNAVDDSYYGGIIHWDNGYPSGGNFWSDYTGEDNFHGPNQSIPGSDGIGDTPYNISGEVNSQDRYPLMLPFNNDTTPPATTHSLVPATPDGDNGWYVHDVEVTLDATDDMSGVKEIRYRIGGGSWKAIPGHHGTFTIDEDGDDILIEYYAIDNAGNEEDINSFTIDMDQTVPDIEKVSGEIYRKDGTWYVRITCNAEDETSGMDRVEFWINDEHIETIEGSGPIYELTIEWFEEYKTDIFWFYHYDVAGNMVVGDHLIYDTGSFIIGLISNLETSEHNVTFFAVIVMDRHYCKEYGDIILDTDIHILKRLSYPNNYEGYIGRFFICATFWEI